MNNPPVINAVRVPVSRVEVDRDVEVTADVTDAETPVDQLTYEWSANAGTFSGSGRTVRWKLEKGSTQTPADVTITLVVVEQYTETQNSIVVTRENRVTQAAAPFRAHDSEAELTKISLAFLLDYFGNSRISPDACLVDFSDSCRGKVDELHDIERNRATFVIQSAEATVANIWISADWMSAEVTAPCVFHDTEIATGKQGTSKGDCFLTAIYEKNRWWLCSSSFLQPSTGQRLPLRMLFQRDRREGD